ncbi:7-carboxy-7-deazaguanine synthase QueE [Kiloniella sp. b19]|uniref:7-carboxy-7-deazaguanine synthase QueE n=1 Tax=Kiloniella sp. GXU_MW_B19 TaxID=3141326 RepID=UPI0031DE35FC
MSEATAPLLSSRLIRVNEIFGPTIQGEGALIGEPTVFVRTGGCDYRCSWCDTLHAVDNSFRHEWHPMSVETILDDVSRLSGGKPLLITLSGGNPAIQPLEDLIREGHDKGFRFGMETQGSVVKEWFGLLDVLTLSPKPPSSEMETDWHKLDEAFRATAAFPEVETQVCLKVVVFDEADYLYAREVASRYPGVPFVLQPGNHTPPEASGEEETVDIRGIMERMRWLIDRAQADHWYEARVLPQLHVLIWGNERGV